MYQFFIQGGPFMWVLLILAIVIVIISIRRIIDLTIKKSSINHAIFERGLASILFWGIMAAIIGHLAHYYGLYLAMMAIMQAADISPAIVAGGFGVSLITIISGLFILMVSAIIWYVLRWQYKRISA
ncbi:hypothetical protein JW960_04440 [candidate division KSB1 bacterium]|nr:hypothetical protein [candidate division KSB1 bacterium]